MKKLLAFTLGEVMITMAIIGVIAAMTMPALNNNIMKNTAATGLAKAINDLESANKLILEQNDLRNISDHTMMADATDLTRYLKLLNTVMPLTVNGSYTYFRYDGGAFGTATHSYTGKNNITYITRGEVVQANGTVPNGYAGRYTQVVVDVNGFQKGPNRLGKDVFNVVVDMKGFVIPEGSRLYASYVGNNNAVWDATCSKQTIVTSGSGIGCAGAVADNGFKVLYY